MIEQQGNIKERVSRNIEGWKQFTENLKLQMHLGKAELRDDFEKQKQNLKKWSENAQNKIEKLEDDGKGAYTGLKTQLEELKLQAALGKAETEDKLKEQQEKINEKIHNVQQSLGKIKSQTSEKVHAFDGELEDGLEKAKIHFELFQVQLALGKAEAKDKWEEKKKNMNLALHDLNQKLDAAEDGAESKWEHFSSEIAESWKHLKNSFKG